MPAASFSALTPRWCQWCQQPLQGRSNQRFCDAACRGKAARHGATPGGPVDWQARAMQAEQRAEALQAQLEQLAHARQALAPLERRYDEFPQVLLTLIPELTSVGTLTNLLTYIEQLLVAYGQHPGLSQGEAGPQLRWKTLQLVQGSLQRQLSYLPRPTPPATPAAGIGPASGSR